MMIKLKFLFFRNYWWVVLAAFAVLVSALAHFTSIIDLKLLATMLGTFLSLLYFLQKQRLEETKLFREIFTECNAKYDAMNEELNAIVNSPDDYELKPKERDTLNDYFNLCGEEYLYYSQGYIFPEVWQAWYNGMQFFLRNKRISSVWSEEIESGSYYGLSFNCKDSV
jgi:hypothetical protein